MELKLRRTTSSARLVHSFVRSRCTGCCVVFLHGNTATTWILVTNRRRSLQKLRKLLIRTRLCACSTRAVSEWAGTILDVECTEWMFLLLRATNRCVWRNDSLPPPPTAPRGRFCTFLILDSPVPPLSIREPSGGTRWLVVACRKNAESRERRMFFRRLAKC